MHYVLLPPQRFLGRLKGNRLGGVSLGDVEQEEGGKKDSGIFRGGDCLVVVGLGWIG